MTIYNTSKVFTECNRPVNIVTPKMDYISECNELYKNINLESRRIDLVHMVLESKSSDIFIKVIKIINNIITQVINFIKSITKNMINILNNDVEFKSILKNKDVIKKFNRSFTIQGFNYTITENVPNNEYLDILRLHVDIMNSANMSTIDEIYKKQISYNGTNNLNKIRGSVLNTNKKISVMEYDSELYKVYRDGKIEPNNIKIDNNMINEYIKDIENYSDVINEIKYEEKNILDKLSKIKQSVNEIDPSILENLRTRELMYQSMISEIEHVLRIYTLAISHKQKAILDKYRMIKIVLINVIQIEGGGSSVN